MSDIKLRTIHGARLRERRVKMGLTLQQVAKKANTSKSYVWELENKNYRPSVFHAIKLAHALNTSVEALFDPDYREGAFNPDYLCQKPQCEENTRSMVKEYSEEIAALRAENQRLVEEIKVLQERLAEAERVIDQFNSDLSDIEADYTTAIRYQQKYGGNSD